MTTLHKRVSWLKPLPVPYSTKKFTVIREVWVKDNPDGEPIYEEVLVAEADTADEIYRILGPKIFIA